MLANLKLGPHLAKAAFPQPDYERRGRIHHTTSVSQIPCNETVGPLNKGQVVIPLPNNSSEKRTKGSSLKKQRTHIMSPCREACSIQCNSGMTVSKIHEFAQLIA